jgi:phage terminase small subunit
VGSGLWDDFRTVENLIEHQEITQPDQEAVESYQRLSSVYEQTWTHLASIAELMRQI